MERCRGGPGIASSLCRMSKRTAFIAWLFLLWTLTSCVTPSVPIPPPEPERMVFSYDGMAGQASFTFDPDPSYGGAIVYVFNRSQGVGVIETAGADGSVGPTRTFSANLGDQVLVTFELDTQLSATCVEFQDGRSSSALECDI